MKFDPVRWVCQFPAEKCDGTFYVHGQARRCPLAEKCLAPGKRTPWEYMYPQQHQDQRKLRLAYPERNLYRVRRSTALRRVFLHGGPDDPDRKYFAAHKDVILPRRRAAYAEKSLQRQEDDRSRLPCGGDCHNCPYDDCRYEVQVKRSGGRKSSISEEDLRALGEKHTIEEIHQLTGISKKTLRNRCLRRGIPYVHIGLGSKDPRLSEDDLRALGGKHTIAEIHKLTGVPKSTIRRRCLKLGIPYVRVNKMCTLSEEDLRTLGEKHTIDEIHHLTGTSKPALWKRCRKHGIPYVHVLESGRTKKKAEARDERSK